MLIYGCDLLFKYNNKKKVGSVLFLAILFSVILQELLNWLYVNSYLDVFLLIYIFLILFRPDFRSLLLSHKFSLSKNCVDMIK